MTPYYEHAGITIYHGDCRDILPSLDAVDVVVTDPPYSEHVHGKSRRGGSLPDAQNGPAACYSRVAELGFGSLQADVREFCAGEFARLARRWILTFADAESVHLWQRDLEAKGLEHVRVGAWVKLGATPQFTGDRPAAGFEAIEIAHRPGRKRWNGGGSHALWSVPIALDRAGNGARLHTTQKPLPLMAALVRLFSDDGETILDPFMGSGSTLVAAKQLGRKAIGIEIEERYVEIAIRRLEQEVLPFEHEEPRAGIQGSLLEEVATDAQAVQGEDVRGVRA